MRYPYPYREVGGTVWRGPGLSVSPARATRNWVGRNGPSINSVRPLPVEYEGYLIVVNGYDILVFLSG